MILETLGWIIGAPGADENDLLVYLYDSGIPDWVALALITRDPAQNTITVMLDHLSEFAVLTPTEFYINLPILSKP